MQKIKGLFVLWLTFTATTPSLAQTTTIIRDTEIASMVAELSTENIEANVRQLTSFGTRHSFSDTISDTRGIGAARRWVLGQFQEYAKASDGRLTAKLDYFTLEADGRRIPHDVTMANTMAVLKGTNPNDNRVLVISGHLDSRASNVMDATIEAPGANDDASGVAVLMEICRVMSQREFSATIIFLAVQGEEQGLYGAKHLASTAKAEGWNLVAMLNNDMVGNSHSSATDLNDNTRLRVFSEAISQAETDQQARLRRYTGQENDGPSRQLARYTKEVGERYVDQLELVLIYRNDRYLRGGDHTPFAQEGFPAIRFCEMNENYYYQHQDVRQENGQQYGDLPEFVDYVYATKAAGVNLAVLATLARAPQAPQNVTVDISQLGNTTTMHWEAPENGPKASGYLVLMRETHWPYWQKKFFTTDTSITLPYSKDNYFFAVQSVSNKGNESVPVWPVPKRN